jgi:proteasome accessory factor B
MDKLERLLNLTAVLLDTGRPLTAEELRRRVPGYPEAKASFRRSFERDKDDLREMGIPLRVERAPGVDPPQDGYDIHKDEYYLRDPGLDPDELAALHLAASAVRLDGSRGQEAVWKLGGATAPGGEPLAALPGDPNLSAAFSALAGRRVVRFGYRGDERQIEPHRLDHRRGRWYLSGHDRLRDDDRVFRLDRIDGALVAEGPEGAYARPERAGSGASAEPWELGEEEPVEARLRVDADQAEWARGRLGDGRLMERHDDGSSTFSIEITGREAFFTFVLSFLDHAVILGPEVLRDAFVEQLSELAT